MCERWCWPEPDEPPEPRDYFGPEDSDPINNDPEGRFLSDVFDPVLDEETFFVRGGMADPAIEAF